MQTLQQVQGRPGPEPGAQPAAVYETAIANLAPGIPRRPTPEDPLEVLTWAGEPLATAEVAAVMEIDILAFCAAPE